MGRLCTEHGFKYRHLSNPPPQYGQYSRKSRLYRGGGVKISKNIDTPQKSISRHILGLPPVKGPAAAQAPPPGSQGLGAARRYTPYTFPMGPVEGPGGGGRGSQNWASGKASRHVGSVGDPKVTIPDALHHTGDHSRMAWQNWLPYAPPADPGGGRRPQTLGGPP